MNFPFKCLLKHHACNKCKCLFPWQQYCTFGIKNMNIMDQIPNRNFENVSVLYSNYIYGYEIRFARWLYHSDTIMESLSHKKPRIWGTSLSQKGPAATSAYFNFIIFKFHLCSMTFSILIGGSVGFIASGMSWNGSLLYTRYVLIVIPRWSIWKEISQKMRYFKNFLGDTF